MKLLKGCLIVLGVIFIYSCQKLSDAKLTPLSLDLPEVPYSYISDTANNNIPTLGRVLFYDTRLSASNAVACASCHKQALAFSDNAKFSQGFAGQLTGRNSMPIQNLSPVRRIIESGGVLVDSVFMFSNTALFWDGREDLLDAMVLRPITNHVEMGMTLGELTAKLSQLSEYKPLFKKAYGSEEITEGKIGVAIGQFVACINSTHSKFDEYVKGNVQLSATEVTGMNLFLTKYNCNNCHQVVPDGFSIYQFQDFIDIGLDQVPQDPGRADVTQNSQDVGKFKIPTLRNVALTAPYMHDGRFATLEEVIDHYSDHIEPSETLSPSLKDSANIPTRLRLTKQEKSDLLAFLHTLTDTAFITDPRHADPFTATTKSSR